MLICCFAVSKNKKWHRRPYKYFSSRSLTENMNRSPAKKVWTLAVLTKCANHKGLLQQLFLSTYGWLFNLWTTPLQMIVFSHLWTHAVHRSLKVVKEVIYVLWLFWPVDEPPPAPRLPQSWLNMHTLDCICIFRTYSSVWAQTHE